METLLINEQFVSQFKYWRDGRIQNGMRFRHDLFEHVEEFNHHQRHSAFDLAWRLTQAGKEPIITVAANRYTIWVNLRSSKNYSLLSWASLSAKADLLASTSATAVLSA